MDVKCMLYMGYKKLWKRSKYNKNNKMFKFKLYINALIVLTHTKSIH